MADKVLNTRVQQKHDIEANWLKATNFIPKIGEVIVYDPDETHEIARVKIGDGEKTVGQLPFISEQADWNVNDESSAAYVKNRTHWEEINYGDVLFDGIVNVTASEEDGSVSGNFTMIKRIGHQPKCMMTIDGVSYEVYAGLDDPYLRLDCSEANFSVFANNSDELNAQLFAWESFLSVGSHEVKIVEIIGESVIHQLDPKFIPTASEEQLIQLLMDIDALPAMTDSNGAIFTHKDSILLI